MQVAVAPGTWAKVSFLALIPSTPAATLSYSPASGPTYVLDAPHFLIGAGAVSLLGTGNATLQFTNTGAAAVTIDILFGRSL